MLRLTAGVALINLLLVGPLWLRSELPMARWVALEALLLWALFALLPRRWWSVVLAGAPSVLVVTVSALGFGDTAARESLARPLNLYLDIHLLDAVRNLVTGTVGPVVGALLLPGLLLVAVGVVVLLALLLLPPGRDPLEQVPSPGPVGRRERTRRLVPKAAAVGVLLVAGVLAAGEATPIPSGGVGFPGVRLANEQAWFFRLMLRERARFAGELEAAPASYAELPGLLARLQDRDVILGFLESYGVATLDDPRYAPVVKPRIEELGERVEAAGLYMASGILVSPTQGGQSWFAHGSLLSGLWLDNQLRYDLLLASGRETLVDDFRRAGHRAVAVMPAITMAWPEGDLFRYDQVLAFNDIDYAGPPLNWVTMPDQFTWSYMHRAVVEAHPGPVFVEVGLISSHAPWTPILTVLEDWDSIGDGSVFARWENAGERPVDLWRDHDRVREHYALSVEYAVAAMTGYAERYVDRNTLLIVMGDHQPAPMITGENAGRGVPVHVISGDPGLIVPFVEWGFVPGPLPDLAGPERGMDHFRDWFVRAYSIGDGSSGTPALTLHGAGPGP